MLSMVTEKKKAFSFYCLLRVNTGLQKVYVFLFHIAMKIV